jgi:hypothetical protein
MADDAAVEEVAGLRARAAALGTLLPWLQHDSWRCDYPQRYPECCCGLDDATDAAGLPRVPRQDNDRRG